MYMNMESIIITITTMIMNVAVDMITKNIITMTTTMKIVVSMTITAAVTATEYFKLKTEFLQAERHYFSVSFFVQNDKM